MDKFISAANVFLFIAKSQYEWKQIKSDQLTIFRASSGFSIEYIFDSMKLF